MLQTSRETCSPISALFIIIKNKNSTNRRFCKETNRKVTPILFLNCPISISSTSRAGRKLQAEEVVRLFPFLDRVSAIKKISQFGKIISPLNHLFRHCLATLLRIRGRAATTQCTPYSHLSSLATLKTFLWGRFQTKRSFRIKIKTLRHSCLLSRHTKRSFFH